MKTLYLDCSMGAAGDMLMAALWELHPDGEDFLRRLNGLGLPGVEVEARAAEKCGIRGTHMAVTVHGEEEGGHHHDDHHHDHHHDGHDRGHHHATVGEILSLLDTLPLPERVRADASEVYRLIAGAESRVHGQTVEQIHFHEVGTLDAVADVVGVCMLMEELGAEEVVASPVHVGSGQVRCAHGLLPVPAPATALLLEGIPIYGGEIRGELCTPTGAALLRHFVTRFGPLPPVAVEKVGYGMGTRDFPAANCLRAMVGSGADSGADEAAELCCNLDDMTGEDVAYAAAPTGSG